MTDGLKEEDVNEKREDLKTGKDDVILGLCCMVKPVWFFRFPCVVRPVWFLGLCCMVKPVWFFRFSCVVRPVWFLGLCCMVKPVWFFRFPCMVAWIFFLSGCWCLVAVTFCRPGLRERLAASSSISHGATQRNTSATPLWFGGLEPVCTAVDMVEANLCPQLLIGRHLRVLGLKR